MKTSKLGYHFCGDCERSGSPERVIFIGKAGEVSVDALSVVTEAQKLDLLNTLNRIEFDLGEVEHYKSRFRLTETSGRRSIRDLLVSVGRGSAPVTNWGTGESESRVKAIVPPIVECTSC